MAASAYGATRCAYVVPAIIAPELQRIKRSFLPQSNQNDAIQLEQA
ncbi:hypothetical protein BSIN_3761 [Burkholderia singularis]|uniref:Uncharacterized protein n=1 Tax=Burkholderia singularis TaxID=1503053 RepID=A0A238H5V4_9BURK|nr:hypothetical protein BSIN_3761 [Burkholderia singularis]